MLTAIQDFMRDSFGLPGTETLGTVQVGELTLWIEPGPLAMLVAVARGSAPHDLETLLPETLEAIHPEQRQALLAFNGDSAPFATARPHLEACLLTQSLPPPRHVSPVVWAVCALLLLGLGLWGVSTIRLNQRWAHYVDTLQANPGLVVTSAGKRNGKFWLVGLRDPLAADPLQLLHQAELDPDAVSSHWNRIIPSTQALCWPERGRSWIPRRPSPSISITTRYQPREPLPTVGLSRRAERCEPDPPSSVSKPTSSLMRQGRN
jgi:hypothetical protein